jgi:hypothetical protein
VLAVNNFGPSPKEVSLLATDEISGGNLHTCLNWRGVR